MQKRPGFSRFFFCLLLATLFVLTSQDLMAQATAAALKGGDVSAFATYSRVSTDYGYSNNGFTFGVGYTHYFLKLPVVPTIEARAKISSGVTVNENTWGGGVRVERAIHNFRPYGNFFISRGTIHYNFSNPYNPHPTGAPYLQDDSIVYSPGAGVDYDLTYRWAARADYQFESWKLGNGLPLTPRALTIGVLYRISVHRD